MRSPGKTGTSSPESENLGFARSRHKRKGREAMKDGAREDEEEGGTPRRGYSP